MALKIKEEPHTECPTTDLLEPEVISFDDENFDDENFDLCSKDDRGIAKLAVARKSFTQRVEDARTTKAECTSHIKAEIQLLVECRNKADVQKIVEKVDRSVNGVLNAMANRIYRLYSISFCLFPVDIDDLRLFLKFCFEFVSQTSYSILYIDNIALTNDR